MSTFTRSAPRISTAHVTVEHMNKCLAPYGVCIGGQVANRVRDFISISTANILPTQKAVLIAYIEYMQGALTEAQESAL